MNELSQGLWAAALPGRKSISKHTAALRSQRRHRRSASGLYTRVMRVVLDHRAVGRVLHSHLMSFFLRVADGAGGGGGVEE